jgi:hypothetical protein
MLHVPQTLCTAQHDCGVNEPTTGTNLQIIISLLLREDFQSLDKIFFCSFLEKIPNELSVFLFSNSAMDIISLDNKWPIFMKLGMENISLLVNSLLVTVTSS